MKALASALPSASWPIDLRRVAARLRPVGVGDRRRQRHRQRRGRRVDRRRRSRWSAPRCARRAPGSWRLALLEDAAAARGERGGNQEGSAEMLDLVIVGPIGLECGERAAGVDAERCRRSGRARARMVRERVLSLAMAANSWPASGFLPCLISASAVISPALPNHGLPGLASGCKPGDHLLRLELSNSSAVWRIEAASR